MGVVTTSPPPSGGVLSERLSAEPPRRGRWMAKRFALAAVGIIVLSSAASYVVSRNEVGKVVEALGETKAVKVAPNVLASTNGGAPQTLLLVDNDARPPPKDNSFGSVLPHSNEMPHQTGK